MTLRMLQGHYAAVMGSRSIEEFRTNVIRFTRSLDFETVSALVVIDHSKTRDSRYFIDNTPPAFRDSWSDPEACALDPVMQHCKNSSIPIIWDQSTYVSHGVASLWEDQARFGFKTGIGVALHLPNNQHFFIGIDRDKPLPKNPRHLTRAVANVQLFAVHAHEIGARLLAPSPPEFCGPHGIRLTPRELEGLRWTMDGKMAREIADILNISERTAVFHLQNATRKLGCKTKFQAVLKAIHLGLMI